jgi:hypothetical protein
MEPERLMARSYRVMKRGIHELSEYEKSEVADELMMPTGVFGAALVAGLLCLALVWRPHALFNAAGPTMTSVASRAGSPFDPSEYLRLSGRQTDNAVTTAPD